MMHIAIAIAIAITKNGIEERERRFDLEAERGQGAMTPEREV